MSVVGRSARDKQIVGKREAWSKLRKKPKVVHAVGHTVHSDLTYKLIKSSHQVYPREEGNNPRAETPSRRINNTEGGDYKKRQGHKEQGDGERGAKHGAEVSGGWRTSRGRGRWKSWNSTVRRSLSNSALNGPPVVSHTETKGVINIVSRSDRQTGMTTDWKGSGIRGHETSANKWQLPWFLHL